MADIIIFVGPTLEKEVAQRIAPHAKILPPVQCGDVLQALKEKPKVLIIIDGFFENTLSVWHKEILYAMELGVVVIGAASMGALRAAELSAYGMIGIGTIFEAYAKGELTDDDEVTICHYDAAHNYQAISDAMVNIRATVQAAVADQMLSFEQAKRLIAIAKSQFYQQRNLLAAITILQQESPSDSLVNFERRIQQQGLVDLKASDAKLALHYALNLPMQTTKKPLLNHTLFFKQLLRDIDINYPTEKEDDVTLEKYQRLYARLQYVCQDKNFLIDRGGEALDANWLYYLVLVNQDEEELKNILAAYKLKDNAKLNASEEKLLTAILQLCGLFKTAIDHLSENFVLPSELGIRKYQQLLFEKFNLVNDSHYKEWQIEKNLTEENIVELSCYYFYYHMLIDAYNPHLLIIDHI